MLKQDPFKHFKRRLYIVPSWVAHWAPHGRLFGPEAQLYRHLRNVISFRRHDAILEALCEHGRIHVQTACFLSAGSHGRRNVGALVKLLCHGLKKEDILAMIQDQERLIDCMREQFAMHFERERDR